MKVYMEKEQYDIGMVIMIFQLVCLTMLIGTLQDLQSIDFQPDLIDSFTNSVQAI